MTQAQRAFGQAYTGRFTEKIAFPLGGIGAGMICLEGRGGFNHVSLRHKPEVTNQPQLFAAVCVRGAGEAGSPEGGEHPARVLEGPVPAWKVYGGRGCGGGHGGRHYGLPRFAEATFTPRVPFGTVELTDPDLPVAATITGWSPMTPPDADSSSMPVAAVEYTLRNTADRPVEAVFSFHCRNFLAVDGRKLHGTAVGEIDDGFVLRQAATDPARPWEQAALAVAAPGAAPAVDCHWFRGGWFDPLSVLWRRVLSGEAEARPPVTDGGPSPGGSLYVPLAIPAGEARTVRVLLSWYVPASDVRNGGACGEVTPDCPGYRPWYAERFGDIEEVAAFWRDHADELRGRSRRFADCLADTTLPPEVVEAVSANVMLLKTPTVLRQHDGRLWCWEGCNDNSGCCPGSCSHVWNYAQAIPHLFPALERTFRETEFGECQDDRGHQVFRAWLPIRPAEDHGFHAAADGQLGSILRVHRDWLICGDIEWVRSLWPRVLRSLEYCIETWDPRREGVLREAHHNTYDIEFWGGDGMCTSIYLAALKAAAALADALGEDGSTFRELYEKGRAAAEDELFNGEYFFQKTQWQGLEGPDPVEAARENWNTEYSPDALELLQAEGPKYQYGRGCLSDGVLGGWLAFCAGVGEVLDPAKVASHLRAVHRHNFRPSLRDHWNCQRSGYALGDDAGLLLCSWPRGGKPTLPFPYSDEVWTGIEYQAAAHMIACGLVDEGLEIVRAARRRYDGCARDPFDEYECGHWYARAMSSFSLLAAFSGARYDAGRKTLHVAPAVDGDFRVPLFTATGYGTVGRMGEEIFVDVREGTIEVETIALMPPGAPPGGGDR